LSFFADKCLFVEEGTPFEGGSFQCKLVFGADYPNTPPKGFFLTKIFHPNVSNSGEICVNTLKRDWTPSHGLAHILTVIRCLLIHPNPESALNEDAGKLLMEDYESYAKRAKMMTSIYAKVKNSGKDLAATNEQESESSSNNMETDEQKEIALSTNANNSTTSTSKKRPNAGNGKTEAAAATRKSARTAKSSLKRL
jgi:ubiquitin-protein ligase